MRYEQPSAPKWFIITWSIVVFAWGFGLGFYMG